MTEISLAYHEGSQMGHSILLRTLTGREPGQRRIHKDYVWCADFVKPNAIRI